MCFFFLSFHRTFFQKIGYTLNSSDYFSQRTRNVTINKGKLKFLKKGFKPLST